MPQTTADGARAVLDVATGATVAGVRRALRLTRRPAGRLLPVARRAAEVAAATAPQGVVVGVGRLRREGRSAQELLRRRGEQVFDAAVPVILDAVLDQVDLTALVLRRVDLDAIAAALDLDAAAARLDLDAAAERLDIDTILDRIDFDAVVATRVDLDGVAARLDIDKILDRIDFDAVVAKRVDLIGLAEYVVDGIDLPRIIRESTGSVASESLRGVRTRSMDADEALAGLVDRMLLRRRFGRDRAQQNGSAVAPAVPEGGAGADR
jgi:hypothetical protein